MSYLLTCPACGAQLRSSPEIPEGEDVRCPRCDHRFAPPPAPPEPSPAAAAGGEKRPGEYAPEPMPPAPIGATAPDDAGYGKEGALPPARTPAGAEDDEDDDWEPRGKGDLDDYDDRPAGPEGLSDQYTVSMGEWFSYAKEHWGAVMGPMIGYFIVSELISMACGMVPYVGGIVQLVINPALQAGFTIVALAQLQGKPWVFSDFFNGFQKFGSFFAYNILAALCVLPLALGIAIPIIFVYVQSQDRDPDPNALFIAISVALAFTVPTMYVGIRVGTFGVPLIIDRNFSGTEALQGSWRMTRGHVLELFGVSVVLGLMALAGVLALCVGLLFVIPFIHLTWAAGYLLIAGRRPPIRLDGMGAERPV